MSGGDAIADLALAARLCALDPALGGIRLIGREAAAGVAALWVAALPGAVRRVPGHIDTVALLGGLDLGATLSAGRPVTRAGLLADARGGALLVPMAERLAPGHAAAIAAALDSGDGRPPCVLAIDEGDAEEPVAAALADRLAFWIDARDTAGDVSAMPPAAPAPASAATIDDDALAALAATAEMLGIANMRAPLLAMRAACASARLDGRGAVARPDLERAARLVLAPRATRLPPAPEADAEPPPPPPAETDPGAGDEADAPPPPLDDLLVEAALAALPPDMLARLAATGGARTTRSQGKGAAQRSATHGRPVGARAGMPRGGARLALIDTLRAAAPWQRVRAAAPGRIRITRDDLRIRRFESRAAAITIFAVDASGSSAMARLGEAKGAVELLLAQAYVKRAEVALIAFRGSGAELLLPPTRSLARAKKALAALPGGGGTPIAAGLDAARAIAEGAARRGRTPYLVVLTDGRANIASDGSADPPRAAAEADAAARAIAALRIGAALVDISPRPRPEGARIAAAMAARYVALPRGDAHAVHRAIGHPC